MAAKGTLRTSPPNCLSDVTLVVVVMGLRGRSIVGCSYVYSSVVCVFNGNVVMLSIVLEAASIGALRLRNIVKTSVLHSEITICISYMHCPIL